MVVGFSLHFRLTQYCFKLLSLSTLNRSLGYLLISSSLGDFTKTVGVALWVCGFQLTLVGQGPKNVFLGG